MYMHTHAHMYTHTHTHTYRTHANTQTCPLTQATGLRAGEEQAMPDGQGLHNVLVAFGVYVPAVSCG